MEKSPEDGEAIHAGMVGLDGALGVGHHAEDIPGAVADAGDVGQGAVGVAGRVDLAGGIGVAEENLIMGDEVIEARRVDAVIALAVGDGNAEARTNVAAVEALGGFLDVEGLGDAAKFEAVVAHEGAGQQAGFAEDLKAVADAENESAVRGVFLDSPHHRGKARNGAAAQVVAIGKSAGQHDRVGIAQGRFLVPDDFGRNTEDGVKRVDGVGIAVGTGELDDGNRHGGEGSGIQSRARRGVEIMVIILRWANNEGSIEDKGNKRTRANEWRKLPEGISQTLRPNYAEPWRP